MIPVREIQKYRYFLAAILVVVMFGTGFLVSDFMDSTRASSLKSEYQKDLAQLESRQLQLDYLKSPEVKSCKVLHTGMRNIVSGYNKRLERVQNYKERSFLQSERFETIKHRYVISGVRYWMFAEDIREQCNYTFDTVLFFTTELDDNNCENCQEQGEELSLIKKERDGRILIFSVPTELEDGMIDLLKDRYNVTETPTVVINGEEKLEGFHGRGEIVEHLDR